MSKPLCCLPTENNFQRFFFGFVVNLIFMHFSMTNRFFFYVCLFLLWNQFIDAWRKWYRNFRFPSWNCPAYVIDHQHLLLEQRNFPSWIDFQRFRRKYLHWLIDVHFVLLWVKILCGSNMSHELMCKNTWTNQIECTCSEWPA